MKLNHVNLTVTDVPAARDFLAKYFGLKVLGERGRGFCALQDDGGLILTLMKVSLVEYPATFHIGFGQENEAKVNEIYERLKADGYEAEPPQRSHGWTFYVEAPGGFTVEVLS